MAGAEWKSEVFANFRLYAVTDIQYEDEGVLEKIEAAYRGGTDIVQLRSKALSDAVLLRLGLKIRKIADRHRSLFFINDRTDLAIAVLADGIHLGQEDLPISAVRSILAGKLERCFIGKSTHSLEQALLAQEEKADYIAVGPVFGTPTKKDCSPVGLELIEKIRNRIRTPFLAIGGIDETNIRNVVAAGAGRFAVVRAIFAKENAEDAARKLRKQIEETIQNTV